MGYYATMKVEQSPPVVFTPARLAGVLPEMRFSVSFFLTTGVVTTSGLTETGYCQHVRLLCSSQVGGHQTVSSLALWFRRFLKCSVALLQLRSICNLATGNLSFKPIRDRAY